MKKSVLIRMITSGTKSSNLDGSGWDENSEIGIEFNGALNRYLFKNKSNGQMNNFAYENAMGYVLGQFNTGVTLFKMDATTGSFQPIIRTKEEKKGILGIKYYVYNDPCNDKK